MSYYQISLLDVIKEFGEGKTKTLLSSFCCPLNADVEYFLKHKAIEFAKQGLSQTQLVYSKYKDETVLVGYYALANKFIVADKNSFSSRMRRRVSKFSKNDEHLKSFVIPALLIAQIGKNYDSNYNMLITGNELLKMACEKITSVQNIIGGKITYLECEDSIKLIDFYIGNGFMSFGKRDLCQQEIGVGKSKYLIQMLKYLD